METHLHGNTHNFAANQNPKEEASPPLPSPPPPSSTSSSPSHEFSFTISLQSLSSSSSSSSSKPNPNVRSGNRTAPSHQSPFAIDLSPADEIFFHGHLLPLHFLSHIPVSPRTSTSSLDGFSLPVKHLSQDHSSNLNNNSTNNIVINRSSARTNNNNSSSNKGKTGLNGENRGKTKPNKSFSLFGLSKWRKGFEQKEREDEEEEKEKQKKKLMSLDLSHAFKKYIRMLFQRREKSTQLRRRQAYSFSSASIMGSGANTSSTGFKRDLRGRRGQFSAPASMRTSPTNSGHLLVSAALSSTSSCSASDSTMEELQAAIQAAIAHCKNSIAVDQDKVKNS